MPDRTATTHGRPFGAHADPPSRSPGFRARIRPRTGSWQVFGLAGTSMAYELVRDTDTYWPSLPRPGTSDPVRMTAVVPTHRCGAVPDSHRVPSYDASRLADGANQLHRQL
ncbi:hypothetical protein GCM10022233_30300 [Streptomyces shaanxiensis]|uniref:Uncharacterized protein n=1 Tax=Streptomyces shaanxiensis TaxID=653357 RepID=A0ABP7UZS0_9ACTN